MMLSLNRRSLFQSRNLGNVLFNRGFAAATGPRTLLDKIWQTHLVNKQDDGTCLMYIDRHLVHEVTSPQAFEGLRLAGRQIRQPSHHLAVADHNVPTSNRDQGIQDQESRLQVETLVSNVAEFKIPYISMDDVRQGIVHIIGPELGFTLPGMTIVCGDSHTATHGAFGALAFGIGTSEVEHVMATQTLTQKPVKSMRINIDGPLPAGITSKDLILHIIAQIGTAGGTGHVIEYGGDAIKNLSMEGRMTMCNMSIEAGARAGMIAPDQITFDYLKGRPMAPKGDLWNQAVDYWRTLPSDEGAQYDTEINVDIADIEPQVTWGTSPEDVAPITGNVPDPSKESNAQKRAAIERSLDYMGLAPGQKISDIVVDTVFIGSCTNGRIEDVRAVAEVSKGRKVAAGVRALVVPGSGLVKQQAETEGLADILVEAGYEWREPGCSMCLAMNADRLEPGQRCASTSNRNFEGRQGRGGRTHLVSPGMAAAAALTGKLSDVRQYTARSYSTFDRRCVANVSYRRNLLTDRGFSTKTALAPFVKHEGIIAPMDMANVDTDKIIPKQFLKTIKRTGLGEHLFFEDRYSSDGNPNLDFVLNQSKYSGASVLVAGENFGCGSSREHAPWALLDFGIRSVISTSFADIFYNNCFKNGILPIVLPKEQVEKLFEDSRSDNPKIVVDLEKQVIVREGGEEISFILDEFRRHCLLNGLDQIDLTLQQAEKITSFEETYHKKHPWV